jgi:hypothetical protein
MRIKKREYIYIYIKIVGIKPEICWPHTPLKNGKVAKTI